MINHGVLMAGAAPLLILARPGPLMLWALPRPLRRLLGRWTAQIEASAPWRALSLPLAANFAHGAAIWVLHMPAFFVGARHCEWLHWLQHASFFFTALLFWWVTFGLRHLRSDAGDLDCCSWPRNGSPLHRRKRRSAMRRASVIALVIVVAAAA